MFVFTMIKTKFTSDKKFFVKYTELKLFKKLNLLVIILEMQTYSESEVIISLKAYWKYSTINIVKICYFYRIL